MAVVVRPTSDRRVKLAARPWWEEPNVAPALSPRAATWPFSLGGRSLRSGFRGGRCDIRGPRYWATGCRVAERALFVGDRTAHGAQMGKGKANAESK